MRNKINLVFQQGGVQRLVIAANIRTCINAVLKAEGVPVKCEINVLVTDDAGIREINKTSRHIDSATDVLSFPRTGANTRTRTPVSCPWGICASLWSGPLPRPRSSATPPVGR